MSALSFTSLNNLSFADADTDSVSISKPLLKDVNGNILTSLGLDQQAQIFVTVHSNVSFTQPFTVIIELRDVDGITLYLQWKQGLLLSNAAQEIGMSWVANFDAPTEIMARAFVISDFEEPIILSSITTAPISISSVIDSELPSIDVMPSDEPAYDTIADYTVLVYMVGSDLESSNYFATTDIYEMAAIGSTADVNVVIETGGSYATTDDYRFIDFREVQSHQILSNEYLTMRNLGEQNMGDPKTLTDFIVWGISQFPAEKYVIILWDHGNGINGFGYDEIFGDNLSLIELSTAFADAKKSTGVDFELIGFDACLMATVEVAIKLSPFGNYLVASEEVEPAWGWDYTAILSSLTDDPDQTGSELGRVITDSYIAHSGANAELYQDYESQKLVTLSVIDLKKIPTLHQRIVQLAESLEGRVSRLDSSYLLSRAVDNTERYGIGARDSSGHVDLYDLSTNIKTEFPNYSYLADDVQDAISDAVIYKVNGEAKPNSNGISIYIPVDAEEFNDNFILYTLTEWGNLLEVQQSTLESDTQAPRVNVQFDGETISGSIEGVDIDKVILFVNSETYDSTRVEVLSYLELEPDSILGDDGSIEFTWSKQIISLCNEDICAPTLMDIEVAEDTVFALFPVRLEAQDVNEPVTLIYQLFSNEDGNPVFEFLGAWPEIDEEGTVSRELWPLHIGDKIYTYTYEYDLIDENYFNYLEYEPIEVTENFQPEYFTYAGTFYLTLGVCDYSDNCSYSHEYQFVVG